MEKLTVFYDGKCPLCYKEILHYKKKDKNDLLICIDITHNDFDPKEYKLDPKQIDEKIHSINESGKVFTSVDTFIEIWKRIPRYNLLIKIVNNQLLRPVFDFSYIIFARNIRPKLPKRACNSGYCELKL